MKKRVFLGVFISTQLFFVCFHIDRQSRMVKLSYEKQRYEQTLKTLSDRKQQLRSHLGALQNHQKIATFAQETLGMKPLFLKHIKHLPKNETGSHETPQQI